MAHKKKEIHQKWLKENKMKGVSSKMAEK